MRESCREGRACGCLPLHVRLCPSRLCGQHMRARAGPPAGRAVLRSARRTCSSLTLGGSRSRPLNQSASATVVAGVWMSACTQQQCVA